MRSDAWAVEVCGLGKRYDLGEREQYRALRDVLSAAPRRAAGAFGRGSDPPRRPEAWVLRDIDFAVPPGEVVGIVGHNGAGKSTLLKVLSRITRPTEGRALMRGRVGSLLEVGSGFHPELTGAENIRLNGAILGMRRAEIDRRFDEIVEFSGVERFLSTPVKRYSTGMYMRLAFAVAAHLEPEILVVDEVLAVGDAEFQRKCLGRMRELAGGHGRTVLFVSHNLDAVAQLCQRTLWLDGGRLRADGATAPVVDQYLAAHAAVSGAGRWIDVADATRAGTGDARITRLRYGGGNGAVPVVGGPLEVDLEVVVGSAPVAVGSLAVFVSTLGGTKLLNADPVIGRDVVMTLEPGRHALRITVPALHVTSGTYRLGLWMARGRDTRSWSVLDHVEVAADLVVDEPDGRTRPLTAALIECDARLTTTPVGWPPPCDVSSVGRSGTRGHA